MSKTKVTSKVIDHMEEVLASQRNDEVFTYFYFNCNDSNCCTPSAALCSLTRQLSVTTDGGAMHSTLMQLYASKRPRGIASAQIHDDAARGLLRQFVDSFAQTTLVIDALNEFIEAERMARRLPRRDGPGCCQARLGLHIKPPQWRYH